MQSKLSQDLATLVNNPFGSDIQFKVGGNTSSTFQENGKNTYDESTTMTLYAHSLILRCRSQYFATMLDENKHWKESSNGIIYKPNIAPSIFQDVLYYIYTGTTSANSFVKIVELIKAAEEMDLQDLSIQCQTKLVYIVNDIFSKIDESNSEESTNPNIPIDAAIRTLVVPILNLANTYSLSEFTHKLLKIILPHTSVIIKSPDAYTASINEISSEAIIKVIASDNLAMTERCVWDLALSWGCHQTKLSKNAVEARLNSAEYDEDDEEETSDGTLVKFSQLNLLKKTLAPLLPFVRFSLLDPEDYSHIVHTLIYFLPHHRYSELVLLIYSHDGTELPDTPRKANEQRISSKIIIKSTACELLRKVIFETGGIIDCPSLEHLKFGLLFRASEYGFAANTFHEYCDKKGPTLVLVKSADGHLFGGVNFNDWKSQRFDYSSSPLNFLFALPDGLHRKKSEIFKIRDQDQVQYSSYNNSDYGPTFGKGNDLRIVDNANTNQTSHSRMPSSYIGSGASNTALAGTSDFTVSDYEVFAISKK